eukprot:TRINITY_DN10142_c0_g1_i1.p1 TRINITY_DN10142_c0_g1~~TRINITY_DN10142_c0_g1_i1.p1  ORF type:complete len:805 (-),score=103.90 TRINITY_DN10142_c0_g1_i1:126-2540(-)
MAAIDSSSYQQLVESECVETKFSDFHEALKENETTAGRETLQESDMAASISFLDRFMYSAENRVAANSNIPFIALWIVFVILTVTFGALWKHFLVATQENPEQVYGHNYWDAFFMSLQVLTSAGYADDIPSPAILRALYLLMIFSGLVVFAVLVGFITESVTSFMSDLEEGRTKVAEEGHTLILGWNEATVRLVCQIALLRRQWKIPNETWPRRLFPWLRLPASTSLASSNVVILSNEMSKPEMEFLISQGLAERGIDSNRTCVGKDIICRVGDPAQVHDLVRARAMRASSICLMMSARDEQLTAESDGLVQNGATIKCLLALRYALFADEAVRNGVLRDDFRIVAQLNSPSEYIEAACFRGHEGQRLVYPVDLSRFKNSLMFECAVQPGLASVLLEMINFDGFCIRRRLASELPGEIVGMTFLEASSEFSDAILIGIVDPKSQNPEGLAPDPKRVIQENDIVIFFSMHSMPSQAKDGASRAKRAEEAARKMTPSDASAYDAKAKKHILICGWRAAWTASPSRLKLRIGSMTRYCLPGSSITFLNAVDKDEFDLVMRQCVGADTKGSPSEGSPDQATQWQNEKGIVLKHVCGDAADCELLKVILRDTPLDTAVVIGTHATKELSSELQDSRVLQSLLALRHVWSLLDGGKGERKHMHIVGENCQDLTSRLALAPRGVSQVKRTDFINTQAICARVIAQTLAYPLISSSIAELFKPTQGSPNLTLVSAAALVSLNVPITFVTVQWRAYLHSDATRKICVGYIADGEDPVFCPGSEHVRSYEAQDKFICIERDISITDASHRNTDG